MKIYYDKNSMAIVMDSLHFGGGSLIAEIISEKIWIKHKALDFYENVVDFNEVKKEDGSQAGSSNQEVVSYLNTEFKKGGRSGNNSFSNNNTNVTVLDDLIFEGDVIIVQPLSNSLNELVFVSNIFDGGFEVGRSVIVSLLGLTNNLKFNWIKL